MSVHTTSNLSGADLPGSPSEILAQDPATQPAGQSPLLEAMDFFLQDIRKKKITLSALHLLIVLYRLKGKTARLNQLAETIGLTGGGLTGVADHLTRMGLAKREIDPHDRRAIVMKLTPEGINFSKFIETSLASAISKTSSHRVIR